MQLSCYQAVFDRKNINKNLQFGKNDIIFNIILTNQYGKMIEQTPDELQTIRTELHKICSKTRREISLNEIDRLLTEKLGCTREKSRGGSAIKYSHPILEKYSEYTAGIFAIHQMHGKSKRRRMISRHNFRMVLWPTIERILNELEGNNHEPNSGAISKTSVQDAY